MICMNHRLCWRRYVYNQVGIHAKIYIGIRYGTSDQHPVVKPRCFNNEILSGARDNVYPKKDLKEKSFTILIMVCAGARPSCFMFSTITSTRF